MNLNYNDFISEVVVRLYNWCNYYNKYLYNPERERYGIYAEFSANYECCINTGIYDKSCTKEEIETNGNKCIFFEGFDWNKDQLRSELDKVILKIWKENEIIYKLKRIEEDFK